MPKNFNYPQFVQIFAHLDITLTVCYLIIVYCCTPNSNEIWNLDSHIFLFLFNIWDVFSMQTSIRDHTLFQPSNTVVNSREEKLFCSHTFLCYTACLLSWHSKDPSFSIRIALFRQYLQMGLLGHLLPTCHHLRGPDSELITEVGVLWLWKLGWQFFEQMKNILLCFCLWSLSRDYFLVEPIFPLFQACS